MSVVVLCLAVSRIAVSCSLQQLLMGGLLIFNQLA
jgi:hypothetical protein